MSIAISRVDLPHGWGGCALGRLRPVVEAKVDERSGNRERLTTPDALDSDQAFDPANRYPTWRQEVAARSAARIGFYTPGRYASRVQCPLLVVVCDHDQSALAEPSVRSVNRASQGELVRLPGGHYATFLSAHEEAVTAEVAFLRRHLLEGS